MASTNFISIATLYIIGVLQGLVLGTGLLFKRKKDKSIDLWFPLLLLTATLWVFGEYLAHSELYLKIPIIFLVATSAPLILGPLLFLHIRAFSNPKKPSFKRNDLLHFLIALVYAVFVVGYFHFYLNGEPKKLLIGPNPINEVPKVISFPGVIKGLHLLFYTCCSIYHIHKQKLSIKSTLPIFILSFIGVQLVFWTTILSGSFISDSFYAVLLVALIFLLGYVGFFFPMHLTKPKTEKYSSNNLSYNSAISIFEKMDDLMIKKQFFLDPHLSLKKMSLELQVNEKQLSQVINQISKKNFSDYVNSHRIEHAKSLLVSDAYRHIKILGIAFESGFNSKDSFYTSFKKFTGKTPSQFRKQMDESS